MTQTSHPRSVAKRWRHQPNRFSWGLLPGKEAPPAAERFFRPDPGGFVELKDLSSYKGEVLSVATTIFSSSLHFHDLPVVARDGPVPAGDLPAEGRGTAMDVRMLLDWRIDKPVCFLQRDRVRFSLGNLNSDMFEPECQEWFQDLIQPRLMVKLQELRRAGPDHAGPGPRLTNIEWTRWLQEITEDGHELGVDFVVKGVETNASAREQAEIERREKDRLELRKIEAAHKKELESLQGQRDALEEKIESLRKSTELSRFQTEELIGQQNCELFELDAQRQKILDQWALERNRFQSELLEGQARIEIGLDKGLSELKQRADLISEAISSGEVRQKEALQGIREQERKINKRLEEMQAELDRKWKSGNQEYQRLADERDRLTADLAKRDEQVAESRHRFAAFQEIFRNTCGRAQAPEKTVLDLLNLAKDFFDLPAKSIEALVARLQPSAGTLPTGRATPGEMCPTDLEKAVHSASWRLEDLLDRLAEAAPEFDLEWPAAKVSSRGVEWRHLKEIAIDSPFNLTFRAPVSGCLTLLEVGSSGRMYLFAPHEADPADCRVEADHSYQVSDFAPDPAEFGELCVCPPAGWEKWVALITAGPLVDRARPWVDHGEVRLPPPLDDGRYAALARQILAASAENRLLAFARVRFEIVA